MPSVSSDARAQQDVIDWLNELAEQIRREKEQAAARQQPPASEITPECRNIGDEYQACAARNNLVPGSELRLTEPCGLLLDAVKNCGRGRPVDLQAVLGSVHRTAAGYPTPYVEKNAAEKSIRYIYPLVPNDFQPPYPNYDVIRRIDETYCPRCPRPVRTLIMDTIMAKSTDGYLNRFEIRPAVNPWNYPTMPGGYQGAAQVFSDALNERFEADHHQVYGEPYLRCYYKGAAGERMFTPEQRLFWYERTPAFVDYEALYAVSPSHPLLAIRPARSRCPLRLSEVPNHESCSGRRCHYHPRGWR